VTEQKEQAPIEKPARQGLDSKAVRTFLTLLAAFLTFAGPTYVVYTFTRVFKIDFAVSMATGIGLFIIGLLLIWYLIKRKVLAE